MQYKICIVPEQRLSSRVGRTPLVDYNAGQDVVHRTWDMLVMLGLDQRYMPHISKYWLVAQILSHGPVAKTQAAPEARCTGRLTRLDLPMTCHCFRKLGALTNHSYYEPG